MYKYEDEKKEVFTELGAKAFMAIKDNIERVTKVSGGIITMWACMSGISLDTWTAMACVDFIAEIGLIREVKYGPCAGQYRIFAKAGEL